MATFTAYSTVAGREPATELSAAMERLAPAPTGVGVFEIEDGSGLWEIGGYFTERPDVAGLELLAAAFGAGSFVVSELPETDWVAKVERALSPVEAGRFLVHGSHDADRVPADKVALLIEAAMAFGTGHHGTTLGCLRALDRLVDRVAAPASVLDLGCGTAVLAMAAARVWPVVPLASDIDAVAVEVAAANVAANGLAGRVRCVEAAGLAHPELAAGAPFDLVFANILMRPLIELAPAVAAAMAPGGHVILSGILNDQADAVAGVYAGQGFGPDHREEIGDWTTLTLRFGPGR